ncbi:DUF3307 domain-containing protein [Abyssisolibacter fermentans]|uniref:DUF3307 domain-containing protein n=1 Tax=Abyssisolibacter fermentans TaxID=1766203 RepID=UPI000832ADB2|nr:DUF3307 domain-containing protein [Abyssisolibacter fermentans]
MLIRLILTLYISHLLCDFVFQKKYLLELRFKKHGKIIKKLRYSVLGNLIHSLMHFLCSLALLYLLCFNISFRNILLVSASIAISHFIIDQSKSIIIIMKSSFRNNIHVFIIDQIFHIISIILFSELVLNQSIYLDMFNSITSVDKVLITIIVLLISTYGIGIFINKFIKYINIKKCEDYLYIKKNKGLSAYNGGFIVGVLERIFILMVIAIGQPTMLVYVLTAKSIVRFKKLDDSRFAEYFLIGTFISFIGGIIGGIVLRYLNIIPIII